MKLNLRDLFWLIFVSAVATMWWIDRSKLADRLKFYELPKPVQQIWTPGYSGDDPFGPPPPAPFPASPAPVAPTPADDPFAPPPPAGDPPPNNSRIVEEAVPGNGQ
jgi:hypothetical protein